jgi:hypothetical protein
MFGGVSLLVLMVWCFVSILHLDDPLYSQGCEIVEVFSDYFIE